MKTSLLQYQKMLADWYEENLDCNCEDCRSDASYTHANTLLRLLLDAEGVKELPYILTLRNRRRAEIIPLAWDSVSPRNVKSLYSFVKEMVAYNEGQLPGVPCRVCGRRHSKIQTVSFSTNAEQAFSVRLCPTCADRFSQCDNCDAMVRKNRAYQLWLSNTAMREYGKLTADSARAIANDKEKSKKYWKSVCLSCYRKLGAQCQRCGAIHLKDNLIEVEGRRGYNWEKQKVYYCKQCAKENKCSICKKPTASSGSDPKGKVLCITCQEDRHLVHDHQYRPFNIRYLSGKKEGTVSKEGLRFGVEIEAECHNSHISREVMSGIVKEKFGYDLLYCVHDGTVRGGAEFVSYPFTWGHLTEHRDVWTEFFMLLQSKDWEGSGSRVGFHIHTTKAAWNSFQLYKLCKFMYDKKNHSFLTTVAQRTFNQYCRIDNNDAQNIAFVAKNKRNRDEHHYNAINLNSGRTVEFRFFRGSLEPWHFFKNLDFVKLLYDFTLAKSVKDMTTNGIQLYLRKQKQDYPYLSKFCDEYIYGKGKPKKSKKKKSDTPASTFFQDEERLVAAFDFDLSTAQRPTLNRSRRR